MNRWIDRVTDRRRIIVQLPTLILLALLTVAAGCSRESDPATDSEPPAPPEPAAVAEDTYEPVATTLDWDQEVQLVPVTFPEWSRELEALKGQVVVVDYWATWCVPCRERFPHMVEMDERFKPDGVTFVSLSLDDRDDPLTTGDVTAFLQEQNARMPNYLMDEIIPDAFEKLELLGIPAVAVYDREGRLHRKLTGDNPNEQFTEEDVESTVLDLLRE